MNLYVGNLDYSIKAIELEQLFAQFGQVHSVKLMVNPKTQKSKGFAFVDIDCSDYENLVINITRRQYRGRTLKISPAKAKD